MTWLAVSHRPSRPAALWATSLSLLVLAVAAFATGGVEQPAFAVCCALTALGPLRATSKARERALLLAYGVGAWALFGLAPVVTIAEPLGGPYGGHPLVFVAGVAAAVARIAVLSRPSTKTWSCPTDSVGADRSDERNAQGREVVHQDGSRKRQARAIVRESEREGHDGNGRKPRREQRQGHRRLV